MRRKEKLIQEISEINDVMNRGEVIRVAMTDGDVPYMIPMSYGYTDGVIYLHCSKEGRKIDMLRKNPNIWFEVTVDGELIIMENSCGWSYGFKCVMGSGVAVFCRGYGREIRSTERNHGALWQYGQLISAEGCGSHSDYPHRHREDDGKKNHL